MPLIFGQAPAQWTPSKARIDNKQSQLSRVSGVKLAESELEGQLKRRKGSGRGEEDSVSRVLQEAQCKNKMECNMHAITMANTDVCLYKNRCHWLHLSN